VPCDGLLKRKVSAELHRGSRISSSVRAARKLNPASCECVTAHDAVLRGGGGAGSPGKDRADCAILRHHGLILLNIASRSTLSADGEEFQIEPCDLQDVEHDGRLGALIRRRGIFGTVANHAAGTRQPRRRAANEQRRVRAEPRAIEDGDPDGKCTPRPPPAMDPARDDVEDSADIPDRDGASENFRRTRSASLSANPSRRMIGCAYKRPNQGAGPCRGRD